MKRFAMKNILYVGFIILSFCFVALGQSTEENKLEFSENWELYEDSNYSIQYPDTFELIEYGKKGKGISIFAKETSDDDLFIENIHLSIENLEGSNFDLDAYMQLVEKQIEKKITDGKILESTRVTDGEIEYHKLVYTGKLGPVDLKWVQHYRVINEKAYGLTFTCEESQYESYASIAEKIMLTFKVK